MRETLQKRSKTPKSCNRMKDKEMGSTYEGESDDGLKTSRHFVGRHFDGIAGIVILWSVTMEPYH